MGLRTASARSRMLFGAGAVGVVGLVAILGVRAGSSGGGAAGAARSTGTTLASGNTTPATTAAGSAPAAEPATTAAPTKSGTDDHKGPATLDGQEMPLKVSVSNTSHLHDGEEVSVHVVPKDGSQVYGFEAFLCAGGPTFVDDADIRPLQTGKCITKPLSAISDKYTTARAAPPYQAVDGKFRVGVGTDEYTSADGGPVTITCGPTHPCQLVLKLQYPNSYGMTAYPLSYG